MTSLTLRAHRGAVSSARVTMTVDGASGAKENALDVLRADHDAVRRALAELEAVLARADDPASGGALRRLAAFLSADLAQHLVREEQALFPVLERHIGREGGPIQVMLIEHAELRRLTDGFRQAVAGGSGEEVAALGRDLTALLAEHVHKEDWVLFPLAQRLLSDDEWAEVGRLLAAQP